ncbi:MAG TPA: hypothetical protein PL048_11850 [Leptospiraceae bacterium]|nr:hypothetical protein [Leptospiraceae bacterium]HMY65162.1 hypothetical protein [Leptospiraceae bacterium]HMZ59463.1 hypothetical protein [Leptospiraceae bacterium]HNF12280.1 hypothetical protein [Leptospiraceae bacterium]HNF28397.1 hypothetical protein [Leptospiraceae bacterium]
MMFFQKKARLIAVLGVLIFALNPVLADSKEYVSKKMEDYYEGEKAQGQGFMWLGGSSIAAGLYTTSKYNKEYPVLGVLGMGYTKTKAYDFSRIHMPLDPDPIAARDNYYSGFSTVMLGFGIAEVALGWKMNKANEELPKLKGQLDSDPKFPRDEYERIEKIQSKNSTYRVAQMLTLGTGLVGSWYFATQMKDNDWMRGASTALVVQGFLLTTFGYFTDNRTSVYLEALRNLNFSYVPPKGLQEGYTGISTTIRF